jgi:membrane protein YqaA with SNARE-associated domain
MGSFVSRVSAVAMALGAPGLFLVAFLDSSFLSLPEIADLMVVYMVTRHKAFVVLYVGSAVVGSVAGCLVMYFIGRKGGEALVRKRFGGDRVEGAMRTVQRHGMMAVLIPSILPPPAPFKIFVLLAGVAGVGVGRFVAALVIGRGVRYVALGFLAIRYGDRAIAYMRDHGAAVSLAAVGVLGAGFAAYLLWSKRPSDPARMTR